jgi:hypothetical protein
MFDKKIKVIDFGEPLEMSNMGKLLIANNHSGNNVIEFYIDSVLIIEAQG